ncbi:5'-nucleotidase [Arthrobacter jiangjiafuii]|uniref:5'-nucleotidase n=1 Tax=Arthrobacter jiangjiafuii TaxID=2817475 RepID=A0A975M4I6_9MICC|nr:5'-nucleotidase [Arthrobacter jiangjiafuii]QWC09826.1 5'-nucleotidase [Arthrobacter jiangjiafuii]
MPYSLKNRLVIGIASSALFDLTESDAFFVENGEEDYRLYQDERIGETLEPGDAFPFIKGLLGLNDLRPGDPVVEVIVLSKNDPSTGLRLLRSVEAHKLSISRAVFTQGKAPVEYIEAFDMSLFLSGNRKDVDAATALGFPAGHVLPSTAKYDENDPALRVAFDFDGVLGGDESERVFKESADLAEYQKHETENVDRALDPGPLKNLLEDLNMIQELELARKTDEPDYGVRLRVSLITARSAPAHERAVRSLRDWGVTVNDAFFLGGIEKSKVLEVLHPHIFFDDQTTHLVPSSSFVAGVHVPYGVANQVIKQPSLKPNHLAPNESLTTGSRTTTDGSEEE